jgi:hypothetical protein
MIDSGPEAPMATRHYGLMSNSYLLLRFEVSHLLAPWIERSLFEQRRHYVMSEDTRGANVTVFRGNSPDYPKS